MVYNLWLKVFPSLFIHSISIWATLHNMDSGSFNFSDTRTLSSEGAVKKLLLVWIICVIWIICSDESSLCKNIIKRAQLFHFHSVISITLNSYDNQYQYSNIEYPSHQVDLQIQIWVKQIQNTSQRASH